MNPEQDVIELPDKHPLRVRAERAEAKLSERSWQPIETAPKDGTQVDLWAKQWRAQDDGFSGMRCVRCYWTEGDSMTGRNPHWRGLESGWRPTHWMLLPDPPLPGDQA